MYLFGRFFSCTFCAVLKSSGLAAAHQLPAINSSRLQGGENPQENHGKTMGKPWEKQGKPGKTMGKPGKTMGKPWENHRII